MKELGLDLAALNLVHRLFDRAAEEGRDNEGTQALLAIVEESAKQ